MNILYYFTTLNYKIFNETASYFNKLEPKCRFAGIIHGHGDIKGSLERKKSVKYEFLVDMRNIEDNFLKEDIDYKGLKEFEETLEEKSLWRFIAKDAFWGYPFAKGAVRMKPQDKKTTDCNNILKVVWGYINYFNKTLSEFGADVVIFPIGMHSMLSVILEQVCKNMNIIHISHVCVRMQNYFTITKTNLSLYKTIDNTYSKIMEGKLEINMSHGQKCYQEMIDSIDESRNSINNKNKPKYFFCLGNEYLEKNKRKVKKTLIISCLNTLCGALFQWYKKRKLEKENNKRVPLGLKDLWYSCRFRLAMKYQLNDLLGSYKYDEYNLQEKYIYFPLISQPEFNTQLRANMWMNQLTIIENLAKSIPFDWKIFVKEHPGNVGLRVRPYSFYREIRSYPNVKFIPVYTDNHEIIKHSQMICTVFGTTGWEAILFHNKPVIHFAPEFYEITGLSKRCESYIDLSREIHNEIARINKISDEEREKRLQTLINAIILNSFWIEEPLKVGISTEQEPTEEDVRKYGKIIGEAMRKHIKQSKPSLC